MSRTTPTTPAGLRRYDNLSPIDAVRLAWTEPGPRPDWHEKMVARVHLEMPLLARALDRLAASNLAAPAETIATPMCAGCGQPLVRDIAAAGAWCHAPGFPNFGAEACDDPRPS